MCWNEDIFCSFIFGVLCAFCIWISIYFSKVGKFFDIISVSKFSNQTNSFFYIFRNSQYLNIWLFDDIPRIKNTIFDLSNFFFFFFYLTEILQNTYLLDNIISSASPSMLLNPTTIYLFDFIEYLILTFVSDFYEISISVQFLVHVVFLSNFITILLNSFSGFSLICPWQTNINGLFCFFWRVILVSLFIFFFFLIPHWFLCILGITSSYLFYRMEFSILIDGIILGKDLSGSVVCLRLVWEFQGCVLGEAMVL